MMQTRSISVTEAKMVGDAIGINWNIVDIHQFRRGLEVELEHGLVDPNSNVTNDDMLMTGKIALAHLNELRDYYTRLDMIENVKMNAQKSFPQDTNNDSLNLLYGVLVGAGAMILYNKLSKTGDSEQ